MLGSNNSYIVYKARRKHSTIFILFILNILLTISIFQRGNTSTSVNKIIKDITNDQEKHYFAK